MAGKFPDPLDYRMWGAMVEVYHKLQPKPKTILELKTALQQIWTDLTQYLINKAMNDFPKRLNVCILVGNGQFECWCNISFNSDIAFILF